MQLSKRKNQKYLNAMKRRHLSASMGAYHASLCRRHVKSRGVETLFNIDFGFYLFNLQIEFTLLYAKSLPVH